MIVTEPRVLDFSAYNLIRFENDFAMANRREEDLFSGGGVDPSNGDDFDDSSSVDSATSAGEDGRARTQVGLTERLTDIFVDERDGDLLIQQTNREDRFLQWLQALDLQVMGACRADERLKPLLKMSTSCGVAEDPLLAQLTQVRIVLDCSVDYLYFLLSCRLVSFTRRIIIILFLIC